MARTRVIVYMHKGDRHVLDFDDESGAKAALDEVRAALASSESALPVTIADRVVVRPSEVRSAELSEPPSYGVA